MIPGNAPQWLKDAKTKNAVVEIEIRFGVEWVIWKSGQFLGGYFLSGEFRDGEFRGGEFRGGYFLGGVFRGGEFRGGIMCASSKWYIGFTVEGNIKIGCEEKTIEEWDEWFKGSEEFNTKRNDPQFKRIYAHYRAVREFKLTMDKEETK